MLSGDNYLGVCDKVPNQMFVGVDIGGTKTAVVLSAEPPSILTRLVFPTNPVMGPAAAITSIVESIRKALSSQNMAPIDLQTIGISCGGPLDSSSGVIQSPPNLPTWKDVPIRSILENEFEVKCHLENDANAGALAEHSFGAGKGTSNMLFLTMGTGLGAGLILNGELYRGSSNAAGEIGHVRLTRFGPSGHNKVGTAEGWASGAGMAQVARINVRAALARGESTRLATSAADDLDSLTARDVSIAAQNGDLVAHRIVRIVGEKLGEVMAILIDVLNPECIIVGGLALRLGEALLGSARATVAREGIPSSVCLCRIVPAALGEQVGDVAALCVAMEGHGNGRRHCAAESERLAGKEFV